MTVILHKAARQVVRDYIKPSPEHVGTGRSPLVIYQATDINPSSKKT